MHEYFCASSKRRPYQLGDIGCSIREREDWIKIAVVAILLTMKRVMRGFLLLGTLLSLFSIPGSASSFVHGPYSGAPSCDTVVISWSSSPPLSGRIEYGPSAWYESQGVLPNTVPVPAADVDPYRPTTHVRLEDLEHATEYVYRVVLAEGETEFASPLGAFSTEPSLGAAVSFAVLADTQWQWEELNRLEMVGDAIAADPTRFDFILHAGDVVESPAANYWDHWFASFGDMLLTAPFIPVLGNHERNHRSYYEAFVLPPGGGKDDERWWALYWGDAVVIGLDTNVRKATEITAQQDWVRAHLLGPEPHKFVIFHHPVFSSDPYHPTGDFYEKIYHPIFVEAGVNIVFNGHSHHYERIVRDGVTYLVVGGGGATPRTTTPEHIEGSDVSVEGHNFYVRVTASSSGIAVDAISVAQLVDEAVVPTDGEVLDSFSLPSVKIEVPSLGPPIPAWAFALGVLAVIFVIWIVVRAVKRW